MGCRAMVRCSEGTKMTGIRIAAALIVLALGACKQEPEAGPGLTFPEPGVVCDPTSGFCSDSYGISLGFSEIHLGKTAAYEAFVAKHSKDDYAMLETRNYRFSDGTNCDHVEMWCGDPVTGVANEKVSAALFAP